MFDDMIPLADPNCPICRGNGRWPDYSEDEWGMVMYIRCDCTKKEANNQSLNNNGALLAS